MQVSQSPLAACRTAAHGQRELKTRIFGTKGGLLRLPGNRLPSIVIRSIPYPRTGGSIMFGGINVFHKKFFALERPLTVRLAGISKNLCPVGGIENRNWGTHFSAAR